MRRVVVTGVGAVSPVGLTTEQTWSHVLAGKSGIRRIEAFDPTDYPSQIAGECVGFDPEKWIERRKVKEGDRFIHLALAASQMAVESARFQPAEEEKDGVGTFIGVGIGGLDYIYRMSQVLMTKGPRKITPYFIPATISNLAPGQVAMKWGFRGPGYTTTSACSSGAHAIGEAFRWIQRGDIHAAVAGGSEAAVNGLGVGGFTAMKALSTRNDDPERASRPFDRGRDGFVIAEGAAVVMLEEREHALARGAKILAEIVGYGATTDAYHLTQPAPEGRGAQAAMRNALKDAKLNPEDIDYVNAHATSTSVGDVTEVQAIHKVFGAHASSPGARRLWVSSTKSMTGHLLGAAGGLEAVFSILALHDSMVPPTINLDDPDPDCGGLDLVPHEARPRTSRAVMSNSFGFGGTNVSLVFKRHES
jgi:3-oxoacyl-[acyl-carrier-protein] synthase II